MTLSMWCQEMCKTILIGRDFPSKPDIRLGFTSK